MKRCFSLIILILLFGEVSANNSLNTANPLNNNDEVLVDNDSLLSMILDLSQPFYSLDEIEECKQEIAKMVADLKPLINSAKTQREITAIFTEYIYYKHNYEFEKEKEGIFDAFLLPSVLANRKGNCLGLTQLYLVLGEALELTFNGAIIPEHAFVLFDFNNSTLAIETTDKGKIRNLDSLRKEHEISNYEIYTRKLNTSEIKAVLQKNIAITLIDISEFEKAERYLKEVLTNFKQLPEIENLYFDLLDANNNYEEIIKYANTLIAQDSVRYSYLNEIIFSAYFNSGVDNFESDKLNEALDNWLECFKLRPSNNTVKFNLLLVYDELGFESFNSKIYKNAAYYWEESLKFGANDSIVYPNLCRTFYEMKKFEVAWKYLRKAEDLNNPVDIALYNALLQERMKEKYSK